MADYLSGSRHQLLFALRPAVICKLTIPYPLAQEYGLRLAIFVPGGVPWDMLTT
jgi:hypothetical protein